MKYTIKEVAEIIGLSSYTLRYYDKEGLLPDLERDEHGTRLFHEKDLQWIYLINCLRQTNMSLKNIKNYISLMNQGRKYVKTRREILINQKQATLEQMDNLKAQIDILNDKIDYYDNVLNNEDFNDPWNPLYNNPKSELSKKIHEYNKSNK